MAFNPSSESDFTVTVEDWGQFATLAAIEVSGEQTPVFDGGSLNPYIIGGRATAKPFQITRPFDRGREMRLYKKYLPLVNAVHLSVTVMPTDRVLARDGAYFSGDCLLTGLMLPSMNNGTRSGAPAAAMVSLTLWAAAWGVTG